jgi:hypothetical protein
MRPTELLLSLLTACSSFAICWSPHNAGAQSPSAELVKALNFHVPFDGHPNATVGADLSVYTAETLARKVVNPGLKVEGVTIAKGAGKFGDALRFAKTGPQVVLYKGENIPFAEKNWSGSVSLWLKLDPDKDLNPDYCDPLQITEKAWNDGAFFVDFDKGVSRDFRLGAFADYKSWNPKDIKWEALAVEQRPMVTVKRPPFASDRWTHVAFTFTNVNAEDNSAKAVLYIDGQSQGEIAHPQQIHWDLSKTAIMIGINYLGDLDELSIFNRALTEAEIQLLSNASGPLLSAQ